MALPEMQDVLKRQLFRPGMAIGKAVLAQLVTAPRERPDNGLPRNALGL